MSDGPRRKFGIADGLILIAGVAAGLGLVRFIDPSLTPEQVWRAFINPSEGMSPRFAFEAAVELGAMIAAPFLAGWTPACLAVQLLKPRPRWKWLRRQPGFAMCVLPVLLSSATFAIASACSRFLRWNPAVSMGDPYLLSYLVGIVAGPVEHAFGQEHVGSGRIGHWQYGIHGAFTLPHFGHCQPCCVGRAG